MKKFLSFILSVIMSISAIASCWNVSAGDLNSTEEMFYESTTSEIKATNSFGKLLVDAIDENEEEFEENGCYIINDLSFELSTGAISVNLNNVDYCNILVGFYSDDGTELITSVSQELVPESDEAEMCIDTSILPENFLIKAYLLDYNQIPMADAYTCNTYTKAMQDILATTIYDFDQDYVVNLDNDIDTNFFVLNSETVMINSTESENILLDADFEDGIYTYLNPDQDLSALNEGDIFYNQCGDSIVIDKVGTVQIAGDTITIISSGTDFQEVFDFIKIESDSSDLDILEMDESVEENAELISFEKKNSNNEEKNTRLFNPTLKKGDAAFWDSFEFKFKLGEDKLYGKKSDDNEELKESEGVTASGDVTFNLDPHINFYWNIFDSYFEANVEVVTKVTFNASLTGSYTGQICKFREIALGANGIYFKVSPVLEVSASAKINIDAVINETFGLHYDSKNKFKSLHKDPEVTTNGLNCTGTVKLYVNFQPKIVLITDKAANIKLDAKAGVKVTMKSNSIFSDFFGNNTEIHECDSCISGKICFFGELSITGSALNGKFSLTKKLINITIPITDYYISSTFNEFGLTECPHYKFRLEFIVRDEQQKPASKATITLTKQQPKFLQLVGITEPIVDKITTNSDGIAEIWYPKSYSSNIPITINVSYNDYESKEFEYQFTGKARKFNVNIYPVGYIEEKLADFVELLKGIDTSSVTTTSTTEPSTITTTTTTAVSENIIASGECGADGDNLTWALDNEGTLTISGDGKMFNFGEMPWNDYCTDIVSVIINYGVSSICMNAFEGCSKLKSITIPYSVQSIGWRAFANCSSLTSLTIPNSVEYMSTSILCGCFALEKLTIPYASTEKRYTERTGVYDDAGQVSDLFEANYYSSSCYMGTDYMIKSIIITGGECIPEAAFLGMSMLKKIELSEDITNINNYAFANCKSLDSLIIPNSVTSIGDYAFTNCKSLDSLIIPNSVTSIGTYAFQYCSSLTSITIPDSITTIVPYAFYNFDGLTSIILPASITKIGYNAFDGCSNLISITIPDSVTSIGYHYIDNCTSLKDIYYTGSKEAWQQISGETSYNIGITIHYKSTAQTAQTFNLLRNKNASDIINEKTYTYSEAVPNTSYLLLAVNDTEVEEILSANNLLYIDQQTADESGSVTFNYIAPDDCTYIFIGDFGKGGYCRVVSNAISTDTEQCTICKSSSDYDVPDNGDVTTTTSSISTTTTTTTSSTTTTMTTTTTTTVSGICGDVNCDGKVNIADAVALEKYINGSSDNITEEGKKNADVNLDGVINDKDVHYLKLSIMNFITLPYIVEDPDNGILYGDVTCDGIVNVCDVIILNKYLSNSDYYLSTQSLLNADVDCDGEVTREDSTYILKSIVHLVMLPINKSI